MSENIKISNSIVAAIFIIIVGGIVLFISQNKMAKTIAASTNTISETVEEMEQLNKNIGAFSDTTLFKKMTLLHEAELKLEKEQFAVELAKKKQELFEYNIGFFGIGTLFGFITLLFFLPQEVKKQAREQVAAKIGDEIRSQGRTIIGILDEYDKETILKREKKMYAYKKASMEEGVKKILEGVGFNEDEFVDLAKSDIVFINDDTNLKNWPREKPIRGKSPEQVDKVIQELGQEDNVIWLAWKPIKQMIEAPENRKKCFFFFSSKGVFFPVDMIADFETRARINFVTNPAQIYGNLMNTLKYQDQISKR